MATYTKIVNGKTIFSSCKIIQTKEKEWISNPTEEEILAAGWTLVAPVVHEPTEEETLYRRLNDTQDKIIDALERFLVVNGITEDDKALAQERQQVRYRLDEIGKIVQEGTGGAFDPISWAPGSAVEAGKWYKTPDDYIWEAIKDGVPGSSTDSEYFDVVGV